MIAVDMMNLIASSIRLFGNNSIVFFVNLSIFCRAAVNTHADAPISVRVVGPASRELHQYL